MRRLEEIRSDFDKALKRLESAAEEARTELEEDGAIQRFEFTFELFWKLLKSHLLSEGIDCASPRGCLKEAFKIGLIEDEESVLRMLEDRNMTAHTYDRSISRAIFGRIKSEYIFIFKSAAGKIPREEQSRAWQFSS